jgi:hypothetical protein
MSSVVRLSRSRVEAPARHPLLSSHARLISFFPEDESLVLFAKHLFRNYGIFTVGDWDRHGPWLVDTFPLDTRAKKKFLRAIGAPEKPKAAGSKVIALTVRSTNPGYHPRAKE